MSEFSTSLLICPKRLSLVNSFRKMLEHISDEVISIDSSSYVKLANSQIQRQIFRFPRSIRERWEYFYQFGINKEILREYKNKEPGIVFVYNSESLLPETCEFISKKSKLVFFLGDCPFFTPVNSYFVNLLQFADIILAPDSHWLQQLNMAGYANTHFFVPHIESSDYRKLSEDELAHSKFNVCDVIYVGTSYLNTWGYKKALLMSEFTRFDFQLYGGKHWDKWFKYFPDLERMYIRTGYIPTQELNIMFNKAKIIPVDGNPGIINGIHIRALEALNAGTLPLIEYRKDVDTLIFKDFKGKLPVIYSYNEAQNIAKYYLENDNERLDTVKEMKSIIDSMFSCLSNANLVLELLNRRK